MTKYWMPALFYNNKNQSDIVEGEVGTDGLLVRIGKSEAERFLVKFISNKKGDAWWFNSSKDRYVAEIVDNKIVANPQLIWQNDFGIVT